MKKLIKINDLSEYKARKLQRGGSIYKTPTSPLVSAPADGYKNLPNKPAAASSFTYTAPEKVATLNKTVNTSGSAPAAKAAGNLNFGNKAWEYMRNYRKAQNKINGSEFVPETMQSGGMVKETPYTGQPRWQGARKAQFGTKTATPVAQAAEIGDSYEKMRPNKNITADDMDDYEFGSPYGDNAAAEQPYYNTKINGENNVRFTVNLPKSPNSPNLSNIRGARPGGTQNGHQVILTDFPVSKGSAKNYMKHVFWQNPGLKSAVLDGKVYYSGSFRMNK